MEDHQVDTVDHQADTVDHQADGILRQFKATHHLIATLQNQATLHLIAMHQHQATQLQATVAHTVVPKKLPFTK